MISFELGKNSALSRDFICFKEDLFSFSFVIDRGEVKPFPEEKAVLVFFRSNQISHEGSRKAGIG